MNWQHNFNDVNLASAMLEIQEVLQRRELAGAVCITSAGEVAFLYKLHAPWSAIREDADTPMGIRIQALPGELGQERATLLMRGAVHTLVQLRDFGERSFVWMGQMLGVLQQAGVTFKHVPHGGEDLGSIAALDLGRDEEDGD